MRLEGESEKSSLKLSIQKTKIMASGPITSWQIEIEKVEAVTNFIFLHSKITADSDYSHKIKRCFLLGRKAMTNLDSVLKSRDITLPTKVRLVKAMVFPIVVYDPLRPHGIQHARPPCPSPTPRVYPNACPLSQWCYPIISSFVVPFSSCL